MVCGEIFFHLGTEAAVPQHGPLSILQMSGSSVVWTGSSEDIFQVVQAASHCCDNEVFHRDIKPENILINLITKEAKLIDFGYGDLLKDELYTTFSGNIRTGVGLVQRWELSVWFNCTFCFSSLLRNDIILTSWVGPEQGVQCCSCHHLEFGRGLVPDGQRKLPFHNHKEIIDPFIPFIHSCKRLNLSVQIATTS